MRVAFVSDQHANAVAFEAVIADLASEDFDEIVCLGDVAQGGPQPVEVVDRLRELGWRCVFGNSDEFLLTLSFGYEEVTERILEVGEWSRAKLGDERLEFLRSFPPTLELDLDGRRLVCCHATPTSNEDVILPDASRERLEEALGDADVVACGHVHLQWMRRVGRKLWFSAGSAGLVWEHSEPMDDQPFDPWAEYAVLTAAAGRFCVEFRRLLTCSGLWPRLEAAGCQTPSGTPRNGRLCRPCASSSTPNLRSRASPAPRSRTTTSCSIRPTERASLRSRRLRKMRRRSAS